MTGMVWCGQVWPGVASRKRAMVRPYQGAAIPGHTYYPKMMLVGCSNKGEVCPEVWPGVASTAKAQDKSRCAVAIPGMARVWS